MAIHLATQVDEGAAAVTAVDRRIRLQITHALQRSEKRQKKSKTKRVSRSACQAPLAYLSGAAAVSQALVNLL